MRPFDLVALPLWLLALYGLRNWSSRPRRNRVLSAMWACWALSATLGAPVVRRAVDAVLGIDSGTNLLVHVMGLGGTAAMLEFVREMTGRAPERVSRLNLAGLATASVALAASFAVMPRPDGEVDLLTYSRHSTAGFLYWMVLTGGMAIGLAAAARLCWVPGEHIGPGSARTSLWLLRVSTVLATAYLVHRLACVTASRFDRPWLAPAAVAGTTQILLALTVVLFGLAVVWPSLAEYQQKRATARQADRIAPLWRLLQTATPEVALPLPEELRRNNPRLRLYRYVIEIRDSALALEGHVGAAHPAAASAGLEAAGLTGDRLAAAIEAVLLRHAVSCELAGRHGRFGSRPEGREDLDLDAEIRWFERVAAVVELPAVVAVARSLDAVPGAPVSGAPGDGGVRGGGVQGRGDGVSGAGPSRA
ncbi:MAB_1171c family putative transporter [Kitasatospora sp. NBC_00458]|uniref:MAB_1171c family putative transporter n=1 Tax=Kitasatospora sp. NBC_00458 TaxID=2903568 RepID=UPI002E18C52D